MKDETVYFDQILDSVRKIESFVANLDRDKFLADEKTQSAVIMQLLLIGETAKKISVETRQEIDLPWKGIIGFRDRAIHNYFDADLDTIWTTVQSDISVLKEKIKKY